MASIEIPEKFKTELEDAVALIFDYASNGKTKTDKGEIQLSKEEFFAKCTRTLWQNWLVQYRTNAAAKLAQETAIAETKEIVLSAKAIKIEK